MVWTLALVPLSNAYSVAPCNEFLCGRHLLSTMPFWLLLAAFGMSAFRRWCLEQEWNFPVLAVSAVVLTTVGARPVHDFAAPTNEAREYRFLRESLKEHSECTFVSWLNWKHEPPARLVAYRRDHAPVTLNENHAADLRSDSCLLFYGNLDCNRLPSGTCASRISDFSPLKTAEFGSRPLSDPEAYGPHEPVIRLGLYRADAEQILRWLADSARGEAP